MLVENDFIPIISGVFGYLGLKEGYLLYELASKSASKCVLEVGALHGLSSIFLAMSGKQVLSIDLWDGRNISDGKSYISTDLISYIRNMTTRGLYNFIPFKMSSKQASEIITNNYDIGLIFIDGAHDYPSVCSDIRNWEVRLKPNTWFLFHDYNQPCGVKKAVDEWVEKNAGRIKERLDVCSIVGFRV